MSVERYALIAGGGTAGHLQPALAIAEALVAAGHDRDSIEFVGSQRGQDKRTLDGRGFPFTLLPGRGIVRGLRARDIWQNIGSIIELAVATVRAIGLAARARPRIVIAVGGYASLPASCAAVLLRIPLVLVNVDAVPGAVNRLFARFSAASIVGWPGNPLPRSVVTGTPVRPEIAEARRGPDAKTEARALLGLPADRPTVAVFGGSLGARRINDAVDGLVEHWKDRSDRSLYQIVGRRDWERRAATEVEQAEKAEQVAEGGLALVRVPYEGRMDLVYVAADLVVCRAGAMTVAELALVGVPSILVPLPGAPGDHQTANARVLEQVGGSILLPDPACNGAELARRIDELLADPVRLEAMGRAAGSLGRPDAAAAGAEVIEAHARPVRGSSSS